MGIMVSGIAGSRQMLVILAEAQILSTQQVCQGCLLANRQGLPRWQQGKLGCGHSVGQSGQNQPALYECQMGFTVANLNEA